MQFKVLLILAQTFLGEQNRARIFPLNCKGYCRHHWRQDYKPPEGQNNVEASLYISLIERWIVCTVTYRLKMAFGSIRIPFVVFVLNKDYLLALKRILLLRLILISAFGQLINITNRQS